MMNLLLSFNFNQVINFLICFFKSQFRFNFDRVTYSGAALLCFVLLPPLNQIVFILFVHNKKLKHLNSIP